MRGCQAVLTGIVVMVCVFAMPRPMHAVVVMPTGDSITWGSAGSADIYDITAEGYRGHLQSLLGDAGMGYDFVGPNKSGGPGFNDGDPPGSASATPTFNIDPDNFGVGGWEIEDMADAFGDRDPLAGTYDGENLWGTTPPDSILLHIGTNDADTHSPATMNADLTMLLENIGSYYQQGDAHELPTGTKTYVARILPRIGYVQTTYDYNQGISSSISALANNGNVDPAFTSGISEVDMYKINVNDLDTGAIASLVGGMTAADVLAAIDRDSDTYVDWLIDNDQDADEFDESLSPDASGQESDLAINEFLFRSTRPGWDSLGDGSVIADLDNPNGFRSGNTNFRENGVQFTHIRTDTLGPGNGLHPTDLGYAVMADVWMQHLVPEPSTFALVLLGTLLILARDRRPDRQNTPGG